MTSTSNKRQQLLQQEVELTEFERQLINDLQGDFPLCSRPFDELAERFSCSADDIKSSVADLLKRGVLTRFGPLFNIENVGGSFSLCALSVPEECFEEVAELVNSYEEVAHNYEREHYWNMWFVLAAKSKKVLDECFNEICRRTGCPGMNLPKEEEFYVGLHFKL